MATSRESIPLVVAISLTLVVPLNADTLPRGDWAAHGFSVKEREALREFLHGSVRKREIPGGALMLLHDGEVIFEEGFGYSLH